MRLFKVVRDISSMSKQEQVFHLEFQGLVDAHPLSGDKDWEGVTKVLGFTRDKMKTRKRMTEGKRKKGSAVNWAPRHEMRGYVNNWKYKLVQYIQSGFDVDPMGGLGRLKTHIDPSLTSDQEQEGPPPVPSLNKIKQALNGGFKFEHQFSSYTIYIKSLIGHQYYELQDNYNQAYPQQGQAGGGRAAKEVTWAQFVDDNGFKPLRTATRYMRLYKFMSEVRYRSCLDCVCFSFLL